ncbi:MAG: hypothetical protein ACKOED_01280 [Aestuariivirga sp.]|uniref:hypothetical protein n=1 Tax=Aestuariivirga sp. TaxID=2650926 RepID=UPI0038D2089D
MKSIKLALMGGAALAVTSAAAHADDLDALKAQIETLNARVAAMEAAPAVPAGYSLLAISEGPRVVTPGLNDTASTIAAFGDKATYISVLPTADAPAGATITWSGYARAGLVYKDSTTDFKVKNKETGEEVEPEDSGDSDDTDVLARGQIRVTASTDTAVGEVGVDIRLRANFDGNGNGDVYSDVAWGYWSMTPELTFGGGYAGSLGNIGYGYDGACTCYYTDNADVAFNPGDVTQFRLSYASGPFSMAAALEDASINGAFVGDSGNEGIHANKLGAAGEIKYSGDIFNGEIAGVWRARDDNKATVDGTEYEADWTDLWQIGAGMAFSLGDIATLSLAGAFGEGPFESVAGSGSNDAGEITSAIPYNQSWWGVSGLISANLTDAIHAEAAVGYKSRDGDSASIETVEAGLLTTDGIDWDQWAVLGGLYYDPVDQLTLGIEAEYYSTNESADITNEAGEEFRVTSDPTNFSVDFVTVWRF